METKEILNFLDKHNVAKMELVMGHQRVHDFRTELTPDIVERLIGHRNSGRLTLFVSPKVHFHSKIYICEFEDSVKMINGSNESGGKNRHKKGNIIGENQNIIFIVFTFMRSMWSRVML